MNVPTITMDKEEARAKLRAYRGQLTRRSNAEYLQVLKGYQALAEGTPVLSLSMALAEGGFDAEGRPRLAVARADREQVMFRWAANIMTFNTLRRSDWNYQGDLLLQFPADAPPKRNWERNWALVPMVPADVRPATGQLREFFVFWEVEQWFKSPRIAQPDHDPYLLKRLGGDLFAVVAEWELTELERAVMLGRQNG